MDGESIDGLAGTLAIRQDIPCNRWPNMVSSNIFALPKNWYGFSRLCLDILGGFSLPIIFLNKTAASVNTSLVFALQIWDIANSVLIYQSSIISGEETIQ